MIRPRRRDEKGFSLIETLAAITVFGLITVGITPLLVSSIRGTALARSQTVAKNLVSEAVERIRGLPYFDAATERDVLDLYFPNLGTGYASATATFTTICTPTTESPAASGALACPPPHADGTPRLPSGYEIKFVAQFIAPIDTNPETFEVVTPISTYNSASEATATPAAQLLSITVTSSWTHMGIPRSFSLSTIVGDRKLSPDKVRAVASVDHVFKVVTAYQAADGRPSSMTGLGARVSSDIEIRAVASAAVDASGGELVLTASEFGTIPGEQLDSAFGAQTGYRAPPTNSPLPTTTAGEGTIVHSGLVNETVGFIDDTAIYESTPSPGAVVVTNGFPKAMGNVAFTGGVGEHFWATNQAQNPDLDPLSKQFDVLKHMFSVTRPTGAPRTTSSTYAEATPEAPLANRKVHATANADAPRFVLLPTLFPSSPGGVVVIDNFRAQIECKSTVGGATGVATGSWSATLNYWADRVPDDNLAVGDYVPVTIGGNTTPTFTADPLAAIKTANPLVYDSALSGGDIYLFSDPAQGRRGYLEDWSTTWAMNTVTDGQSSRVSMPFAISILTARTNPNNEESRFAVNIGKMSCQAVDKRA